MKQNLLLFLLLLCGYSLLAQKTPQKITAYAITGPQKGQSGWTEVRLIDVTTGEEVKSVYQSADQFDILNARTGKPIVKKDGVTAANTISAPTTEIRAVATQIQTPSGQIIKRDGNSAVFVQKITAVAKPQYDKPFATTSAACAYDKKHERLYYTPMGINELRYIDLKSKTTKIYYFQDEKFGALANSHDVPNQITRMVFASDGNGYALTNNANHLIQFTTGKKPTITDLGGLTDDASNAPFSVHSAGGYGGDMIADAQGNLYLVTANRNVFRIALNSKVATFLGSIQGLPKGFTTNGAIVEGGSLVIVSSSNSTQGYFKFDLNTLKAEKISTQGAVFNASDLANATLAFEKVKKEEPKQEQETVKPENPVTTTTIPEVATQQQTTFKNSISVYPNPVTNGLVKISFADQPEGRYQIQLIDISGKLVSSRQVNVNNKVQLEEFRLPSLIAKGSYLVKVVSDDNKVSVTNKLIVE